jgi:TPR repeat protein
LNASSLYNRSLDLLKGQGVAKDERASFKLNSEAASGGHHDAVLAMGWYYLNGVGVGRDVSAAKKWYRRSARQGEPRAMFSLGQIAYDEKEFGIALLWFRRASELKHVRSLYWIAKMSFRGDGVEPNSKIAESFLQRAAAAKNPEATRFLRYRSSRSANFRKARPMPS